MFDEDARSKRTHGCRRQPWQMALGRVHNKVVGTLFACCMVVENQQANPAKIPFYCVPRLLELILRPGVFSFGLHRAAYWQ